MTYLPTYNPTSKFWCTVTFISTTQVFQTTKYQKDNELERHPILQLEDIHLGKILWKVSQKMCLVHCLYTRLIKDFVCQCITDILKAILQQAEMLHPPFRYQCGCEQWPNPTTTTYKQELSKTPPANTSNKWKLKLVIRKWLHYKRGLKTFLP